MQLSQITLAETHAFSTTFLDYLSEKQDLQSFYTSPPTIASFAKHIESRKNFDDDKRKVLHQVLNIKYEGYTVKPQTQIDCLLSPNTFTVTTGHQLNIFSGPLYFIFKIISTISLAEQLKKAYPEYHFVPVYWMASEDHDFEEINHFHLFGQNYTWETTQKGGVGRFNPSEMKPLLEEISPKLGIYADLFKTAYLEKKTLAEATQYFVHEWFGKYGLLCLDADDATLKNFLKPTIADDIFKQNAHTLVGENSKELEEKGYKTQIMAREINFFYLDAGLRERIVQEGDTFKVLNTELQFSKEEIEKLIENNPEKFSPNVVLRPLYQEIILPNLAYLGGPSEIIYWLQLKTMFDFYQAPFPILFPRNFGMLINKTNAKKIEKLELPLQNLFMDETSLKQWFFEKNSQVQLDFSEENTALKNAFEKYASKAIQVDKSLEGWLASERQKIMKNVEIIENRLRKTEEKKSETEVAQLIALKNKLFPNNGLQERFDNILNYLVNQPDLFDELIGHFNPIKFEMNIMTENE